MTNQNPSAGRRIGRCTFHETRKLTTITKISAANAGNTLTRLGSRQFNVRLPSKNGSVTAGIIVHILIIALRLN